MSAEQAIANSIWRSIVEDSNKRLREKREADRARPVGTKALDIDFYTRAEAGKPIEAGSMMSRDGRYTYTWEGAQWAVWLVRWTGTEWRRVRRITGPIGGSGPALDALYYEADLRGLERIPD